MSWNDPLVSVVVPVYNVEPYIAECLRSVLGQTYTKLEIIVVDDGSTDGSAEICDAISLEDSRVRVFRQANSGPSSARNAGTLAANGEFVTYLDSDDWWERDFVETLVSVALDSPDLGTVMSSFTRRPGETPQNQSAAVEVMTPQAAISRFAGPDHTLFVIPCAKLFRREVMEGVTFPESRSFEDEFTTHRLLMRAPVAHVDKGLYNYRMRAGSTMHSDFTPQQRADAILAAEQQRDLFVQIGLVAAAGWAHEQALRKRMRLIRVLQDSHQHLKAHDELANLKRSARASRGLQLRAAFGFLGRAAKFAPRCTVSVFILLERLAARRRELRRTSKDQS